MAFERSKALVNNYPNSYFDYTFPIILYTNASDYAHGNYLCQLCTLPDGVSIEEPISFLGGIFQGPQVHNREGLGTLLGSCSAR